VVCEATETEREGIVLSVDVLVCVLAVAPCVARPLCPLPYPILFDRGRDPLPVMPRAMGALLPKNGAGEASPSILLKPALISPPLLVLIADDG